MLPRTNKPSAPGSANLPIGELPYKHAPTNLGWHSRGYLPHFESSHLVQHVTFRLADSLPQSGLRRLEGELQSLPIEERNLERRTRIEAYLDAGFGSCILREPHIARIIQQSLLAFDGQRYRVLAWVVMPNHVHVLFESIQEWTVARIVTSWKKFTARQIRDACRGKGKPTSIIWQREYWDRYIRNREHLMRAIEYIHRNPVQAALVTNCEDWQWSSACWPASRH